VLKVIRKKINQYVKSSAATMLDSLTKEGVSANQIEQAHLKHFYDSLKPFRDAPNFDSVKSICDLLEPDQKHEVSELCGVIVETREHAALEPVIENVLSLLQIPIQLYHGTSNLDYINQSGIKKHIDSGRVVLTALNIDILSAPIYNALFLSSDFWKSVIGRSKILVFQTDALLCKDSKYSVSDFIKYDYIGSAWNRGRPVGMIANGGNGGLSIRDWHKTCDVLTRFPSQAWPAGEDGYFAFHLELIGAKVADLANSRKFGTQLDFVEKSFGCHKITDLSNSELLKFLVYCPEANVLL
jgi:hypothetical protein